MKKQVGSNDCGLFCIPDALDLAEGNDPSDIEYDQSCMRWHLVECFKKGKLALFPRNSRNLISRSYSCQPIILLSGSYFLVKAKVMREKEDL